MKTERLQNWIQIGGMVGVVAGMGVTVEYTGTLLADAQKDGWHVLTF